MRYAILLLVLCCAVSSKSQDTLNQKVLNHELELIVENDVFVSLIRDQYYSSGIFGSYRHALDTSRYGRNVINTSRKYSLTQRMYTAKFVEYDELDLIDRPYAGIFSLSARQDFFFRNGQYFGAEFELGWMGPKSFTGDIHEAWHGFFGLPDPNGWFSQINDALVANLYLDHAKRLLRSNSPEVQGDITSVSRLSVGTIYNSFFQGLLFRYGKTRSIEKSTHFGNTLSTLKPLQKSDIATEAYIFYQPAVMYVAYDGTLQGGLITGNESLFTKEPVSWRFMNSFGLLLRYGTFDINLVFYIQPAETDGVSSHSYGAIELRQRF